MIALLEWQMLKNDEAAYAPWWAQRLLASSLAPIRCCVAARQTGKALRNDMPVLTPTGWKPIGELAVGDAVIAGDGTATTVVSVHPQGYRRCYLLTFDDGASVVADEDHRWAVVTPPDRKRQPDRWTVLTTREIVDAWGEEPDADHRIAIPLPGPCEQAGGPLPLNPYLLGALLADGSFGASTVLYSKQNPDTVGLVRDALPSGAQLVAADDRGSYRITGHQRGKAGSNPVLEAVRDLGFVGTESHEKWVPESYLLASVEDRRALLAGLLDGDGSCDRGHVTFSTTSPRLRDAVVELARSLGGKATARQRQTFYTQADGTRAAGRLSYRVTLRVPDNPFLTPGKAGRWFRPTSRRDRRVIRSIKPAGTGLTTCITVGHPSALFVTRDFIVTHNSTQAAHEVVKTMSMRPRSTSCLLMPTVKSTVGPLKQLRAALERALGPEGGRWTFRKQEGCFRLWNGAELYVRTCDAEAKEGVPVRGMTIDGILWVDEAAYVPQSAWNAARGMLLAVRDPKILVTGTPCGKTWLYDLFKSGCPGPKRDPMVESFRFKAQHSPFASPEWIASERARLGPKLALQELDAVFLGDGGSVFTDAEIDRMLVAADELPIRGEQRTLGVDVGIDRDFVVLCLMNEFGEAWILDRFRDVQISGIVARVQEESERHDALVVVDVGQGGGHGGALASLLTESLREHTRLPAEGRILKIRTGNPGVKSEAVVTFQTAVQNDRIKIAAGEHAEIARNEFRFFEGHKKIIGGTARWTFSGPKSTKRGETKDGADEDHDDIVMACVLANWGKEHGWNEEAGGTADFSAFKPRGPAPSSGRRVPNVNLRASGGYFYR